MPRKVFTAGEVLAAADVNEFLMDQAVQSFAGTAARGSAIGTAVEGMTTFREDIDRLESWTGSQWTSPSDLVLIKSQTIGSAVASVTVSDAFSADYDVYQIILSGGTSSTNNTAIGMRLGSNAINYRSVLIYGSYSAVLDIDSSDTTRFFYAGNGLTNALFGNITLNNPFNLRNTGFQAVWNGSSESGCVNGYLNDGNSYTDFTLATNTGTITGGTINVYGYRKTL
jgi:hypothetical protein